MDIYPTEPSPRPLFFTSPFLFPTYPIPQNYVRWTQTPLSHLYTADLPGARKEEIRVEVEDSRYLVIRTEYTVRDPDWSERRSFMRKFILPGRVDVDGISAGYEDGVLTVTVPRSTFRRRLRICLADLPDNHDVAARAA